MASGDAVDGVARHPHADWNTREGWPKRQAMLYAWGCLGRQYRNPVELEDDSCFLVNVAQSGGPGRTTDC
jgi:hypothetical protein